MTKPEEKAAQDILEQIFKAYKPTHEYITVQESEFKHLDLGFYRRVKAKLEKLSFRYVCDVEDLTVADAFSKMFKRVMIRVLVSNNGAIMVGLYHPKLKLGWGLFLWLLRSLPGKAIDFETEFTDSRFIVTSNAESAALLSSSPLIFAEHLKKDTPVEALLALHQKRIGDYLGSNPDVTAKQVFTHVDITSSQNRMNAIKAAYRGELKGISKSELDKFAGPKETKDAIYSEIRKINEEKND